MRIFLENERLIVRQFTPDDVDNLATLNGDPAVMRFLTGGRTIPREVIERETLPRYLGYYERYAGFGYWAAVETSTGAFLGWFGLRPADPASQEPHILAAPGRDRTGEAELGYRLKQSAWGKGYASEGARALIRKAFAELGVRRIVANTMAVNLGSRQVMEKCGMRLLRTFHQDWPDVIEGGEQGDVEYAIERADWEHREAGLGK